jgi:hypothetical protein
MPDRSTRGSGLQPPTNSQALADLWSAYDSDYDAITAQTLRIINSDPELEQIVKTFSGASQRPPEVGRRLLRDALLNGDWEPYLRDVRGQAPSTRGRDWPFISGPRW